MERDATAPERSTIEAAVGQSRAVGLVHATVDRLEAAADTSRTVGAFEDVGALAARSRLYQWWTTPPAEDPIRIDVRESRLVGPIVTRAVPVVCTLMAAWRRSGVRRAGAGLIGAVWAGPVRVASAVLLLLSVTSLVATWQRTTPVGVGTVAILVGVGLLGLRDGRSWNQLRESRVGRVLHGLVGPPTDDAER